MPTKLFQKGNKFGTLSSRKGIPNNYTQEFKELVMKAVNDPKWIAKMKETRPEILSSLAKAIIPKDVNIGGQPDNELVIKIAGKYGN